MVNAFDNVAAVEPSAFFAGDTVQWERPDLAADYTPGDYSLSYTFRKEGAGATTFAASSTATDFRITIAAATSAAYTAGRYQWSAVITRVSDSAKITVASGTTDVLPNKATSTDDPRSHARKVLDSIKAMLEGRTTDVANYSIAGRSLVRMNVDELLKWKAHYEMLVKDEEAAEDINKGLGTGNRVLVRFSGD